MGAPIAPKWIKSASSTANAKTLENTADGGYQEVDALSADVKAALTGAASPSAANPFATVGDLEESGVDVKTVKASSTDASPGYLDAKVDDVTLEVSGDKLQIKSGGHAHAQSEVTGLDAALSGKASTSVATTSADGLMSAADKIRLDALETAALTIASIESY